MSAPRPPRFWERLLEWSLPAGLSGEATLGDLNERYAELARTSGLRARLWYARQALSISGHHWVRGTGGERMATTTGLAADVRWGVRLMRRKPAFAGAVIGILGLGLGAAIGVFTVVDGTLRDASWWASPDRTVAIWPASRFSAGQLDFYAQEQEVYRSLGGFREGAYALRNADGESRSLNGLSISPALFPELAAQPVLGRGLVDTDAIVGAERVVVISEDLWRQEFGAREDVLGTRIDVAGAPTTIVGVLGDLRAPSFRAALVLPHFMDPRDDDFWRQQDLRLVGALTRGATLEDARASLDGFTKRLRERFPMFFTPEYGSDARVEAVDAAQQRTISTPLVLLFAATLLLVLATALNTGSLLLGRAVGRRRELAVRAAIGAAPSRVVRQLVVEGLLLSLLALAVGSLVATWVGDGIVELFVAELAVRRSSILSPAVLAFAGVCTLVAGLVLNGVPVAHFLQSQRARLQLAPDSGAGAQKALVVLQAALATALLVSAVLLVGTVRNLRSVPLGFDPAGVVALELSLPMERIQDLASARRLYIDLVDAARTVPGVEDAGLTGWLPLREDAPPTPVNVEVAPTDPARALRAALHRVDAGFFSVLGVTPIAGRLLDSREDASVPSAVVVNETLARALWPSGDFRVGERIAIDPHAWNDFVPVVGVVPDIKHTALTLGAEPAVYAALSEGTAPTLTLLARGAGDPEPLLGGLGAAVAAADALVPVRRASEMSEVVRAAYSTAWVLMGLLIVLAFLTSALGMVGVYAVLAHYVFAHTRAIGIRLALGAHPRDILTAVLRSGLALTGSGILIGAVLAAVSSRLFAALLFGVERVQALPYLIAAVALLGATLLASALPALRASRLQPSAVLRMD